MLQVTFYHLTGTYMIMVNMHKAKSTLSQLVEAALAGEEVIIARRGVPVVQIVPIAREADEDLRPIGLGVNSELPRSSRDPADYSVANDFMDDDDPNDPLNW